MRCNMIFLYVIAIPQKGVSKTDYSAVQPKVVNITVLPDKVILEWL